MQFGACERIVSSSGPPLTAARACPSTADAMATATDGADTVNTPDAFSTSFFPKGATVPAMGVYIICKDDADARILAKCHQTTTTLPTGDDSYCIAKGTSASPTYIDCIGDMGADPGNGWTACAVADATKSHTLRRKPRVTTGTTWANQIGHNSAVCDWEVLPADDWTTLGSHQMDGGPYDMVTWHVRWRPRPRTLRMRQEAPFPRTLPTPPSSPSTPRQPGPGLPAPWRLQALSKVPRATKWNCQHIAEIEHGHKQHEIPAFIHADLALKIRDMRKWRILSHAACQSLGFFG